MTRQKTRAAASGKKPEAARVRYLLLYHEWKNAAKPIMNPTDPLTDPLTGLLNRAAFVTHVRDALTTVRAKQTCAAVLILDMDALQWFNDTFGHTSGDVILRGIAARFAVVLPPGAILCRYSGDEFMVFLPDLTAQNEGEQMAQTLEETLQTPFFFNEQTATVSVSSGTALFPRDGDTVEALMQHADEAMWQAKAPKHEARRGKGSPFSR